MAKRKHLHGTALRISSTRCLSLYVIGILVSQHREFTSVPSRPPRRFAHSSTSCKVCLASNCNLSWRAFEAASCRRLTLLSSAQDIRQGLVSLAHLAWEGEQREDPSREAVIFIDGCQIDCFLQFFGFMSGEEKGETIAKHSLVSYIFEYRIGTFFKKGVLSFKWETLKIQIENTNHWRQRIEENNKE